MANRIPLVIANNKMREIANGDTLDLSGNPMIVGGHLTPAIDSAYDLGDSSKKWKDLHLSGNTIYLGGTVLSVNNNNALVFKDSANGADNLLGRNSLSAENAITEGGQLEYDSARGRLTFTGVSVDSVRGYFQVGNGITYDSSKGMFTIDSDLTITGNLTVQGTQTILNSETLTINDKTIIVADSSPDSSATNGAGLEVATAGASMTYNHTNTAWDFNRIVNTEAGAITIKTNTGNVAYLDVFCEVGNSHRVRVKSPTHSQMSGGNVDVVLPDSGGTLGVVATHANDILLIKDSGGSTLKTITGVGNTAL